MSQLAPNLFQRRFDDLVEIGRARLPALAPEWTDHNLHDPGITLMELLAWVAEAQLYSLSRLGRNQRVAYAALLGVGDKGTQGATGMIWPHRDPQSPARTSARTAVISQDTEIHLTDSAEPTFRPTETLLWVPGQIEKLETFSATGLCTDHTAANERGSTPFKPLGDRTGASEVLALTFTCRDRQGLFGYVRDKNRGARWPIGVLVAPPSAGVAASCDRAKCSPLSATLRTADALTELKIAHDPTHGLLSTGVLLLDLDNVPGSPQTFILELSCPGGFSRPPELLRIEPNVLPIQQGWKINGEAHESNGAPDWSFKLNERGLRFAAGKEPVEVELAEPAVVSQWKRTVSLADCGPDENVFQMETKTGEITFGNGVNGRIPPANSTALVTYSVSDGVRGGVARNRQWIVGGFAVTFGVNLDPMVGGLDPANWIQQRGQARRLAREQHALVSSDDITAAALALPLLEVGRVWIRRPKLGAARTGVVTLVAMRKRSGGKEPEAPPETPQWLGAIRRALAPRLPLGSRLVVVAPQYVEFAIEAVVECLRGADPAAVKEEIAGALQQRLALVDWGQITTQRRPGVPLTVRDVKAWLRVVPGVKSVKELRLRLASGKTAEIVQVPRGGLPRWIPEDLQLDVVRPEPGRTR